MSDIKSNRAAEIRKMYADDENMENTVENTSTREVVHQNKTKGNKILFVFILIVILAVVALYVISKTTNWDVLGVKNSATPAGVEPVKASDWQAVFLTNGQVYFGKLKSLNDNYPTLEDVYYLQVQNTPIQPAQAAGDATAGVQNAATTQQQLILVKFGTELHRPMDKMYLNKDHIMFFEDLSSASSVVTAIDDYKKNLIEKK